MLRTTKGSKINQGEKKGRFEYVENVNNGRVKVDDNEKCQNVRIVKCLCICLFFFSLL